MTRKPPLLTAEFFANNRRRLAETALDGGVLVLAGHRAMQAAADISFPFVQEPNFYYLTGISAPDWMLVYDSLRDHTWLVRPRISEIERIFDGELSDEAVLGISGANEVIVADGFEPLLRQLARRHSTVYGLSPLKVDSMMLNPATNNLHQQLLRVFDSVIDVRLELARLRAIKQPIEVRMLQQAVAITAKGFSAAHHALSDCRAEYGLEAIFTAEFRRHNTQHAYSPIVASGPNATTLHYTANNQPFGRHSLVLCDIGAQWCGYAADVTRMLPIGRVTKRQRQVYDALLSAQQAIIDFIGPNVGMAQYQTFVDQTMHAALRQLGLMDQAFNETTYRRYFPHAISHGLGLDVHDRLGAARVFKPGMVLTVEPGIYIEEEGIGMRIEDDIYVSETGRRNLTAAISTTLD